MIMKSIKERLQLKGNGNKKDKEDFLLNCFPFYI